MKKTYNFKIMLKNATVVAIKGAKAFGITQNGDLFYVEMPTDVNDAELTQHYTCQWFPCADIAQIDGDVTTSFGTKKEFQATKPQ